MKLGGLFSGIGGFELAWTQLGHEVAWMCEIDPRARAVLAERFPGVTIYEDVCDIDPAEIEAVDVLTGGSPCQGFSIAGKRTGLEHSESKLFVEYIRIMDGLAARGLQWAVWENVPGVLSIKNADGERSFPHVIAALLGADEPAPLNPKRKWNAGVASYGGREVAWRVLDSQYFGVPQRRRRVFACVAFGDSDPGRAGRALLAVSESVRGDSAAGGEAGKEAAGAAAESFSEASAFNWQSAGDARGLELKDVPSALTTQQTPAVLLTMREGASGESKDREEAYRLINSGNYSQDGTGSALKARDYKEATDLVLSPAVTSKWAKGTGGPAGDETQNLVVTQAYRKSRRAQSTTDHETWVDDGTANTLNVFDISEPRTTHAVVESYAYDEYNMTTNNTTHHVLRSGPPASGSGTITQKSVRRLTPVECERLQGFPDNWTTPAKSDSARYKALGNAVTVNTVHWILNRILTT